MKPATLDEFRTVTASDAKNQGYIALAGPYADNRLNIAESYKELVWLRKVCDDLKGKDCVFVKDSHEGTTVHRHNSELDIDPHTGVKLRHHKQTPSLPC